MTSFSELTGNEKRICLLRWIGVFPAAVLARLAVGTFMGVLTRLAIHLGAFTPGVLGFAYYVQLLASYLPKEVAFVIAGAMMAPRHRFATSIALATTAILMSLIVHILGQPNRSAVNFMHFGAESVGAVIGAAYIYLAESRVRSCESTPASR